MPAPLPNTQNTPLLRTGFSDPAAWDACRTAVETPNEDEFLAYVDYVDDPVYRDLPAPQILPLAPDGHPIVIVADETALACEEFPLLVIDLTAEPGRTVRVIAEELWSIENNLSITNMDFSEFADAADEDGVFRGFI
jgi:hypothetical protein